LTRELLEWPIVRSHIVVAEIIDREPLVWRKTWKKNSVSKSS